MDQKEKQLTLMAFQERETDWKHLTYEQELRIYDSIKMGDLEFVKGRIPNIDFNEQGHLSDDPLRNFIYNFICGTTLVTRFCIEGGMESQDAYNLSDLYIQHADTCKTTKEVQELFGEMLIDFTTRMRNLHRNATYSKPVEIAVDFIYEHQHEFISLDTLSNLVGLTPAYFSTLFKKETGVSPTTYIRARKIDTAKNMLRHSDYSYTEISNILAYNSHSHFISSFKKAVGMTPKEYRDRYYRSNWN